MSRVIEGKMVWITGAGSGIGRACALAFAGAGARLVLTGRRAEPLEETAGLLGPSAQAMIVPADIGDPDSVRQAHAQIVDRLGHPDILINNAGLNIGRRHWRDLQPDGASHVIDVILKGPFQCSLAVLPAMRARRDGILIHIASISGVMIHVLSGPSYSAAKHGVISMSDTLNAEEGIHGIRSICISPGEVATPILEKRLQPPSATDRALMLQPEDVAAAALFCASLPARACVKQLVITPTDDNSFRAQASVIEATPARD